MRLRLPVALFLLGLLPARTLAQTYTFYTVGGLGGSGGSGEGTGGSTTAPPLFAFPEGLGVDSSGNIFVSDSGNHTIRKITPAGAVSTFAGTAGIPGSIDGTGRAANFNVPEGGVFDSSGNYYVADYRNSTIRKVTSAGVVTTIAGSAGVVGAVNGTGAAASFGNPRGVAVDGSGNVYVADSGNHVIRKITSAGVVTTLAGTAGTVGHADGTGGAATFNYPSGITVDSSGNLYVADTYNHLIRKVTSGGVVTTFAGAPPTTAGGVAGHADGTGTAASFDYPSGLAIDGAGNIYVADQGNNLIRKITSAGAVTTLAGPGPTIPAGAYVPSGAVDGAGTAARFNQPTGVAVDSSGNVFVADYLNQLIRKVTPSGTVSTVAGAGGDAGSLDGSGFVISPSLFWRPTNLAIDSAGNIFVADTFNDTIRKILPSGLSSTIAGAPISSTSSLTNEPGFVDGTGSAARFNGPTGVAAGAGTTLYVADTYNHAIRKVDSATGVVTTLAGNTSGTAGSADGTGSGASFNFPSGVAVGLTGIVYVADYNNNTIRAIDPNTQVVTTLAGVAGVEGSADGLNGTARFKHPRDVAVDPSTGNIYVADSGNHLIRMVTPAGSVSTIAGTAGVTGSTDATGTAARFNGPSGISVDSSGNIFVTDSNNNTIRQVTSGGVVTTIGGLAGTPGDVDGTGTAARFDHPSGIAVDSTGNVFIADNNNNTIREGIKPGNPDTPVGGKPNNNNQNNGFGGTPVDTTGFNGTASFLRPIGIVIDSNGNAFIADTQHHCIKKVTPSGVVSIFAGQQGTAGSKDAVGTDATFNTPTGLAIGTVNTLFVTDTGNACIRRILTDGTVATIAGSASGRGSADGTGTAATFASPTGITISVDGGTLFVADSGNNIIRTVTLDGVVKTVAGTAGMVGDTDANGAAARFNNPNGLSIDSSNDVYIADTYNDTIRMMTPTYDVSTFAGSAGVSGSYDGIGTYALFNLPGGVTVTPSAVLVMDTGNNVIRSINRTFAAGSTTVIVPTVSTVAGFPGLAGAADGIGNAALFNQPQGGYYFANDAGVYITDTGNSLIRFVVPSTFGVNTPTFSNGTTTTTSSTTTSGNSGGGGGGGIEGWFALALGGLAAARFGLRRRA